MTPSDMYSDETFWHCLKLFDAHEFSLNDAVKVLLFQKKSHWGLLWCPGRFKMLWYTFFFLFWVPISNLYLLIILCKLAHLSYVESRGKWQHIPHWRKNKWKCPSSCVCTCWCCWCGNGSKVYTWFIARCVLMLAFFLCNFLLLMRIWWLSICKHGPISTRKCALSLSSIGCSLLIMCFSSLSYRW